MPAVVVVNQPGVILYDANGNKMAVQDGVAIPANTSSILIAGADGTTARTIAADSIGRVGIQNPPNLDAGLSTRASLANQTNGLQKSIVRSGDKGTASAADITSNAVDANTEALDISLETWFGSTVPTVGQKEMAASIPVTMASNQSPLQVSVGVAASAESITAFLTDDGTPTGSHDMVVNGSGTPEVFTFNADATSDIILVGLRLVFSAQSLDFDGGSFGKGSELSGGIELDIVADSGTFAEQLAVLTLNEDFFRLLQFDISRAAADGVMAATLPFGGRVILVAGTADKITVTINDNLPIGSLGVNYLTATLYGIQE